MDQPIGRSGHTSVVVGDQMFIFGGILEVTKELNDLLAYDHSTKEFRVIYSAGENENNYHSRLDDVPLNKGGSNNECASPGLRKKNGSPATKRLQINVSPTKKPP